MVGGVSKKTRKNNLVNLDKDKGLANLPMRTIYVDKQDKDEADQHIDDMINGDQA